MNPLAITFDLNLVDDLAGIMSAGITSIKVFPPKGTYNGRSAAQVLSEHYEARRIAAEIVR